jgi:uncharacterized membrane protein
MSAETRVSPRSNVLRLILTAAVFVAVHGAILAGAIHVAVALVMLSLAFAPAASALRAEVKHRWLYAAIAALMLILAACALSWPGVDGRMALVLPAFLGSMLVSGFFAYSLLPNQVPVIVRMCHITRGQVLPDGLERYARNLTWGWAVLPALLAFAALAILGIFGLEAWSWANNVANPIILASFFAGEHVYRARLMPHLGKPSMRKTFDVMVNKHSWRRSA